MSRIDDLNLTHLFRADSRNHTAAEILLAGEPVSRPDLERQAGVPGTAVSVIVDKLRNAGVPVRREVEPGTRHAVFQALVDKLPHAPEGTEFSFVSPDPKRAPRVTIDKLTVENGKVRLTADAGAMGKISAVARMSPGVAALATEGLPLTRVTHRSAGLPSWTVGVAPNLVVLTEVTPAT